MHGASRAALFEKGLIVYLVAADGAARVGESEIRARWAGYFEEMYLELRFTLEKSSFSRNTPKDRQPDIRPVFW